MIDENCNDALDILIMSVEKLREEVIYKLHEYDVDDDLLFDILEIFYTYFPVDK